MHRKLFLDLRAGIAGDMFVAALIDLGAPLERVSQAVESLGFGPIPLRIERVRRGPFHALRFLAGPEALHLDSPPMEPGHTHDHEHRRDHEHPHDHHHDHHHGLAWSHIRTHILEAPIAPGVRDRALKVFGCLAQAEGRVHGVPADQVEFHEVGAVDSIADIVGAAAALDALGIDEIVAGPVPLGEGEVRCAHGLIPLPAPATLALLEGWPLRPAPGPGEWTTPTGAALLAGLARPGVFEAMVLRGVGHGAGMREHGAEPNVLRAILGEEESPVIFPTTSGALLEDEVELLEAQMDDMPGEWVPPLFDALFAAGAIDVFATAVIMKKGRPGLLLCALSAPARAREVASALLRHGSTKGVRHHRCSRWLLDRRTCTVETPYGEVRLRSVVLPGSESSSSPETLSRSTPEYEDCVRLAREHGVPVSEVYRAAQNLPEPEL